jgi:tRNA modification GTPase
MTVINNMYNGDTIFAQATPAGYGAISIIRISGNTCLQQIKPVFFFANKSTTWEQIESHKVYFGHLKDNEGVIDEALCTVFIAPRSYTKENSIELSFHGSPYVSSRISKALIKTGIRLANAGEFTMRAFLNGRFDLSQAEAVADIITSHSHASHQMALNQFRGEFSHKIETLRQQLIDFTALIELELDFSDEDVEFAKRSDLLLLVQNITNEIVSLKKSFSQGNVIKQGIPVAIAGRPNAGKSTLLNLLLKDDKALVSEIPGTTRDALEDIISIDGVSFRFIDTAGLRQTDDVIENMGIERTLKMIDKSQIVLYVADVSLTGVHEIIKDIEEIGARIADFHKRKIIIVANKTDLLQELPHGFKHLLEYEIVYISAKRKENIELLEDMLKNIAEANTIQDGLVVSNTRHYEALMHSEQALNRVFNGLQAHLSEDLLSADLRDALHHLGLITGKITNDEILDSVFRNFCIGK